MGWWWVIVLSAVVFVILICAFVMFALIAGSRADDRMERL